MDPHGQASVHAIVDEMLEDGMKVLAVAYKPLQQQILSPEEENGLTLLGYLAFFDAPKQSAATAIEKLQKSHVEVRVLTGDNQDTAVSICRRLGIDTAHTLTGAELALLTDNEIPVKLEHMLWMKLFGTASFWGINMGFWVGMAVVLLIVVLMNVVFWSLKPKNPDQFS